MSTLVCTLEFGKPSWLPLFQPSLLSWVERHGHRFSNWRDECLWEKYPCPKFCIRDMLRGFLASGHDRMIYIDGDVWVHPEAPDMPVYPGLAVATDDHHRSHNLHFAGWCSALYGVEFPEWEYCNAGVWSVDREAAERFLAKWEPPFVEYFQDQHFFNAAACRARADGMTVVRLPSVWNMPAIDFKPAWFQHAWACDKAEVMRKHPKEKP